MPDLEKAGESADFCKTGTCEGCKTSIEARIPTISGGTLGCFSVDADEWIHLRGSERDGVSSFGGG
jgi:hypothetical protein